MVMSVAMVVVKVVMVMLAATTMFIGATPVITSIKGTSFSFGFLAPKVAHPTHNGPFLPRSTK